ncbi:MAG TPA: NUDIX hydrolase [Ktedonobacterales bacterium]|nr:NUDIX hydrolase [Ktedonobacterales bacterium]
MAKKRVVRAFSAGGVVFRVVSASSADGAAWTPGEQTEQPAQGGRVEIALVGHVRENIWTLPKGTPAPNETREQTALREVREETGLETRIVAEVGQIEYTFTRRGMRFIKQVFHYLMLATGGSVEQHDHEYDEARWFTVGEALVALTYDNEIEIARRAEQLISHYLATQP